MEQKPGSNNFYEVLQNMFRDRKHGVVWDNTGHIYDRKDTCRIIPWDEICDQDYTVTGMGDEAFASINKHEGHFISVPHATTLVIFQKKEIHEVTEEQVGQVEQLLHIMEKMREILGGTHAFLKDWTIEYVKRLEEPRKFLGETYNEWLEAKRAEHEKDKNKVAI